MMYFDKRGKPITTIEWSKLMGDIKYKRIGLTDITPDISVSTVWLGLDHSYSFSDPPLIFETMVFGGEMHETMVRYNTEKEAWRGHSMMVRRVRKKEGIK